MRAMMGIRTVALAVSLVLSAAIGVVAQAGTEPTAFTSRFNFDSNLSGGAIETTPAGFERTTGEAWRYVHIDGDEPRFAGPLILTLTFDDMPGAPIVTRAYRLENEGGAWQEVPTTVIDIDNPTGHRIQRLFIGEGGYAGSYAVVIDTADDPDANVRFEGFIIEGEPPPAPTPWVAE